MECSMTGAVFDDSTDGIWDDGEFISWDWINGQIYERELQEEFPAADVELVHIFNDLVNVAADYKARTGRYLQIWGELGELYGELKYGIKRHAPCTKGSDGRLGNDFIEIKTISPEKSSQRVDVKRSGNFSKLLIVKIDEKFDFYAQMFDRKSLPKGTGKRAKVAWTNSGGGNPDSDG